MEGPPWVGPDEWPASNNEVDVVRLDDVAVEEVEWLWPGFIPYGKLTLIEGDPALGKSTLTLDIAARITTGRALPDGSVPSVGNVLMLSAEDGVGDTIRPRFEAAGGNSARFFVFQGVRTSGDDSRPLALPGDLRHLEGEIARNKIRLVIIDPLTSFLAVGTDNYKELDMRRVLGPLGDVGQRHGTAILPIRHFNKSVNSQAMYRGMGSIGITATARSVLAVARHPSTPGLRVLIAIKSNLTAHPSSIEFTLEQAGAVARIHWLGKSDLDAATLLSAPDPAEADDDLEMLFKHILSKGPVPVKIVYKEIRDAGFMLSERSLRRVRKRLGIKSKRSQFSGIYHLTLPEHSLSALEP